MLPGSLPKRFSPSLEPEEADQGEPAVFLLESLLAVHAPGLDFLAVGGVTAGLGDGAGRRGGGAGGRGGLGQGHPRQKQEPPGQPEGGAKISESRDHGRFLHRFLSITRLGGTFVPRPLPPGKTQSGTFRPFPS